MIDAVRALGPAIRDAAPRSERERRLPAELVAAMARAGVFRLCVPRAVGGEEADPLTMLSVLEELACADGAAGWCAMIGATSGLVSGYLDDTVTREIWGADRDVVCGGVFAPTGHAVLEKGAYRVTGRWRFASGCQHCAWLLGGSLIAGDGAPRARMMLFPARDAEVIDTWTVAGLCGTGSHDIAVRDLRVPQAWSVSLTDDRPSAPGPLYVFPVFGLLALGIAAVAVGIARRAVDELVALAIEKTPTGGRRRLADRGTVQTEVALAEGDVGAARAFLIDTVGTAWDAARADGAIGVPMRSRLRLAATHATAAAARAVDRMYTAGGGTAVYATSPLQRCFRDVHVVTQHMMVAPATLELVGRLRLGLDAETSML